MEGKIRLLQPLTGQGAGAHDTGLQGLPLAAVALTRGAEKSTGSHREDALEAPPASLVHDEAAPSCAVVCGFAVQVAQAPRREFTTRLELSGPGRIEMRDRRIVLTQLKPPAASSAPLPCRLLS